LRVLRTGAGGDIVAGDASVGVENENFRAGEDGSEEKSGDSG
jgi:hypothetical protein